VNHPRAIGTPLVDTVRLPITIFAGGFFIAPDKITPLDDAVAMHEDDAVGVDVGVTDRADICKHETGPFCMSRGSFAAGAAASKGYLFMEIAETALTNINRSISFLMSVVEFRERSLTVVNPAAPGVFRVC
jgi:hypothetical protein